VTPTEGEVGDGPAAVIGDETYIKPLSGAYIRAKKDGKA